MTRKQPAAVVRRRGGGGGAAAVAALKRGPWSPEEDELLSRFVAREGEGRWRTLPRRAGLLRCGKSCRLRWMNYLRPDIKRGPIAADEEDLILRLHRLLGNRWSLIAGRLPGRTDNEIKNYWNSHLSKKLLAQGIDPRTHRPLHAAHNSNSNANSKKPCVSPPPPSASTSGAGVAGEDGGSDFAAAMGLDADGFDGFGDEFRACWDAPCAGFDLGFATVDDATFSSFLDSLISEDQFVDYFGDHNNASGGKDQGSAS